MRWSAMCVRTREYLFGLEGLGHIVDPADAKPGQLVLRVLHRANEDHWDISATLFALRRLQVS